MENSRRSKKRSKFFWPEIGLLILGVLGFKPELLYSIFGVSGQSAYSTTRPVNQQPPTNQHPQTSNPLLAWGVQAIQSAANQTMNGLPVATQPNGQPQPTQQQYYPHYSAVQNPTYQQPMNYMDYGHAPYQTAPANSGYAPVYNNWAATSNGNLYVPTAATYYPGAGAVNRVPPAEYQNTPASFPNQGKPTVPFPPTNAANQANTPNYGTVYGTNVRKEGMEYADPRLTQAHYNQAQLSPSPYNPSPYNPSYYAANNNGRSPYASFGSAQTPVYSNPPYQTAASSQDQYYWGAVDPRVNNSQRADIPRSGTQGSWVPNVPAWNPGTGRVVRY